MKKNEVNSKTNFFVVSGDADWRRRAASSLWICISSGKGKPIRFGSAGGLSFEPNKKCTSRVNCINELNILRYI